MGNKKGIYGKYRIEKASGITDLNADYFVLILDKDPHALEAIKAYSESVMGENFELALDLREKYNKYSDKKLRPILESLDGHSR